MYNKFRQSCLEVAGGWVVPGAIAGTALLVTGGVVGVIGAAARALTGKTDLTTAGIAIGSVAAIAAGSYIAKKINEACAEANFVHPDYVYAIHKRTYASNHPDVTAAARKELKRLGL